MVPYWTSTDGAIVVYCARWEDVVAAGCVDVPRVALVHADPPYGLGMKHARKPEGVRYRPKGSCLASGGRGREWENVVGDDEPFDPAGLLALSRPSVLWGGNHFASRLPDSAAWFLWDKRGDMEPNDGSDGEAAWTNIGGSLRIFRHHWRGVLRASEQDARHLHPTQKPVALSTWVFQRAKIRRGDLVFVPYGGSGPDLPAARAAGLRVIACDVESWCCDTAIARLPDAPVEVLARAKAFQRREADAPKRAAEPVGPLFE